MGYQTIFHGELEFTRRLTRSELAWLSHVMDSHYDDDIKAKGLKTGKGLNAGYAGDFSITDDMRGIRHSSEKTNDAVGGINFIIVNARTHIPDFGLRGFLLADTEMEPCEWLLKIGADGMAHQQKIGSAEFLAIRRQLYPDGYDGLGPCEPEEHEPAEPKGTIMHRLRQLIGRHSL